ncbi:hypothetical protein EC2875150_0902 [Escherichia coli 2875150]|nr:hypothetical protein EC2875150_0902 [Escherichia coli 2875150]
MSLICLILQKYIVQKISTSLSIFCVICIAQATYTYQALPVVFMRMSL